MRVKILKSLRYSPHAAPIHPGTKLVVRVFNTGITRPVSYQVIEDGPHCGVEIPFEYCVELPKERTYTVAEYSKLKDQLDAALSDITKHGQTIRDLETRLEPVVLPELVAETVELKRLKGQSNYSIIDDFARERTGDWSVDHWARGNSDTIIRALVNGYTVEQSEHSTTEGKIKSSLTRNLIDMKVTSPVPVERLAKVLTLAVREVLAEDRQAE